MTKSTILKLVMSVLTLFSSQAWGWGTSVGDGGSVFRAFVKDTRARVIDTIEEYRRLAKNDPALSFFCTKSTKGAFSPEQLQFCRDFIKKVHTQFVDLISAPGVVDFDLVDGEVTVLDRHGNTKAVDAKSPDHRPETNIEISQPRVENFSPAQMLWLWFHELGHKIEFEGEWIEDYKKIGPFAEGDVLLDAIATSMVDIAVSASIVSESFSLFDRFSCSYVVDNVTILNFTGANKRYFTAFDSKEKKGAYDNYRTGFSSNNPYWKIFFHHPNTEEKYFLLLHILEDAGCDPDVPSVRRTRLLLKNADKDASSIKSTIIHRNPICEAKWGHKPEPLAIDHTVMTNGKNVNFKFSCVYTDSFGLAGKPDLKDLKVEYESD